MDTKDKRVRAGENMADERALDDQEYKVIHLTMKWVQSHLADYHFPADGRFDSLKKEIKTLPLTSPIAIVPSVGISPEDAEKIQDCYVKFFKNFDNNVFYSIFGIEGDSFEVKITSSKTYSHFVFYKTDGFTGFYIPLDVYASRTSDLGGEECSALRNYLDQKCYSMEALAKDRNAAANDTFKRKKESFCDCLKEFRPLYDQELAKIKGDYKKDYKKDCRLDYKQEFMLRHILQSILLLAILSAVILSYMVLSGYMNGPVFLMVIIFSVLIFSVLAFCNNLWGHILPSDCPKAKYIEYAERIAQITEDQCTNELQRILSRAEKAEGGKTEVVQKFKDIKSSLSNTVQCFERLVERREKTKSFWQEMEKKHKSKAVLICLLLILGIVLYMKLPETVDDDAAGTAAETAAEIATKTAAGGGDETVAVPSDSQSGNVALDITGDSDGPASDDAGNHTIIAPIGPSAKSASGPVADHVVSPSDTTGSTFASHTVDVPPDDATAMTGVAPDDILYSETGEPWSEPGSSFAGDGSDQEGPEIVSYEIAADMANVRWEGSEYSRILGQLSKGTEIEVLSVRGNEKQGLWYEISRPGGKVGWVNRKVVKKTFAGEIAVISSALKDSRERIPDICDGYIESVWMIPEQVAKQEKQIALTLDDTAMIDGLIIYSGNYNQDEFESYGRVKKIAVSADGIHESIQEIDTRYNVEGFYIPWKSEKATRQIYIRILETEEGTNQESGTSAVACFSEMVILGCY